MKSMDAWLDKGVYLPEPIRDFHDQKDLFKSIHELVNVEGHSYCKDVTWVSGQCYVVDIFLWWMAKRGYTLQRSRKNLEFGSLIDDVHKANQRRQGKMDKLIRSSMEGK